MRQTIRQGGTNDGGRGFLVTGRVVEPARFDLPRLLAMDMVSFNDMPLHCGSGEPKGTIGRCRGVLLTDAINATEVVTTAHNDTKKMFLVVSSGDGYKTVFSWQELFNTSVGEGVIIVVEQNGVPLHDGGGAVDIFSANDFLSGPRYVKRVATIEIIMIG